MTREELLQDLAYARSLAEEGRHAPLLGGAYLCFWGVLNAAAFSSHWGVLQGRLPGGEEGWGFAILWGGYGVIAAIGTFFLGLHTRHKPGLTTINARVERAVWRGAGGAVLLVAIGSIARMILDNDLTAPNAILGAAFALYGAALIAVSIISGHTWLRLFGWTSALLGGLLCAFANDPWVYLIAAAGSLTVLLAPGLVLLRREPSTIV